MESLDRCSDPATDNLIASAVLTTPRHLRRQLEEFYEFAAAMLILNQRMDVALQKGPLGLPQARRWLGPAALGWSTQFDPTGR